MLSCVIVTGCDRRLQWNINAAHELVVDLAIYCNQDYTNGYPWALSNLVSVGLCKSLPQCECADGTNRDFIYVPGFHETPYGYVFLASPPEMDKDVTIVCFGGEKPKALPWSVAEKEIEKSRALVKVLNNSVVPFEDPKKYTNSVLQQKERAGAH